MVKLNYCCIRNYKKNQYIPFHAHENGWEFIQYLDLNGRTQIGQKVYEFNPDTVSFIPKGVLHDELNYEEGSIFACNFSYDGDLPNNTCTMPGDPFILSTTRKIIDENTRKQGLYRNIIECYITEIIIHILRKQNNISATEPTERMKETVRYLDEYYMTDIDFGELAKSEGYSLDHFRVLFKKETGLSLKKYILDKRLALAKQLIKNTGTSLVDIGLSCGFEYYSQFSLFFKKRTGVSPLEYRNNPE